MMKVLSFRAIGEVIEIRSRKDGDALL